MTKDVVFTVVIFIAAALFLIFSIPRANRDGKWHFGFLAGGIVFLAFSGLFVFISHDDYLHRNDGKLAMAYMRSSGIADDHVTDRLVCGRWTTFIPILSENEGITVTDDTPIMFVWLASDGTQSRVIFKFRQFEVVPSDKVGQPTVEFVFYDKTTLPTGYMQAGKRGADAVINDYYVKTVRVRMNRGDVANSIFAYKLSGP